MLKWAGSDPYPSMELPGLGQIVRWSLTHLYNWGKPMPAAVQRTKFLEVSSWSEVAGQRAGVFGACSGVCGSPQNCSTCAAAELRLINYTLLMVSPWRLLFWWGSIDQITHTFVPHNAHTLTHTQSHTSFDGAWQCRTPRGCDQTHFCFHWGPAEVCGGFDSSSILAWVLAPVPLLVFEASHIRNTCVFSKLSCSSGTLYAFSSFSFFHIRLSKQRLSDKWYPFV